MSISWKIETSSEATSPFGSSYRKVNLEFLVDGTLWGRGGWNGGPWNKQPNDIVRNFEACSRTWKPINSNGGSRNGAILPHLHTHTHQLTDCLNHNVTRSSYASNMASYGLYAPGKKINPMSHFFFGSRPPIPVGSKRPLMEYSYVQAHRSKRSTIIASSFCRPSNLVLHAQAASLGLRMPPWYPQSLRGCFGYKFCSDIITQSHHLAIMNWQTSDIQQGPRTKDTLNVSKHS